MGKILIISLVFFFCMFSSGFALTADDIFISLDKNVADLTFGYAEFTIKNPTAFDLNSIDFSKFNFQVQFNSTPVTSSKLFIWKNVSHDIPVYMINNITSTCKNWTTNTTYKNYTCYTKQTIQNGTKKIWRMEWVPMAIESFKSQTTYKVRIEASWKLPKSVIDVKTKNAKFSVSMEWIPLLDISGLKYYQTKWAWWNASWSYSRGFNMTETSGVDLTDYTFNLTINPQSWAMQSGCGDIRIINVTNSISLPYNFTGCNDTAMNISFKDSISASAKNEYKLYYGNPTATYGELPFDQVVLFYDDFDDSSLNTTKWTTFGTAGGVDEGNGTLKTAPGEATATGVRAATSPSLFMKNANYSVFANVYHAANDANFANWIMFHSYLDGTAVTANSFWTYAVLASPYEWVDSNPVGVPGGSNTSWSDVAIGFFNSTWNLRTDDGPTLVLEQNVSTFISQSHSFDDIYNMTKDYNLSLYGKTAYITYFDNISVKRFSSSEPAFQGIGGEETNITYPVILITLNYPANQSLNNTNRTIKIGYNATFYGGTPKNCSLFTTRIHEESESIIDDGTFENTANITFNGNGNWSCGTGNAVWTASQKCGYVNTSWSEDPVIMGNWSSYLNGTSIFEWYYLMQPLGGKLIENTRYKLETDINASAMGFCVESNPTNPNMAWLEIWGGGDPDTTNNVSEYVGYPNCTSIKHLSLTFNASPNSRGIKDQGVNLIYVRAALVQGLYGDDNSMLPIFDNVRLYALTDETTWNEVQLNSTPIINNSLNNITKIFSSDAHYKIGIACWDDTFQNFSENVTIYIDWRNTTSIISPDNSITVNFPVNISVQGYDIDGNKNLTTGTMTLKYTKPDNSSHWVIMAKTNTDWYYTLTPDQIGAWSLVFNFSGEDYWNSTNSSTLTVNMFGGGGGGNGAPPPADNVTENKTIEIFIEGIDWPTIDSWLKDKTHDLPNAYIVIAILGVTSYAFRKHLIISILTITLAVYLFMNYGGFG